MGKERPILFSGAMVRAILDGKKTQTRRIVKPFAPYVETDDGIDVLWATDQLRCRYGEPGDRLWVRETWAIDTPEDVARQAHEDVMGGIGYGPYYRADGVYDNAGIVWRPSIHMFRWASRLTLRITDVRVERLQDISEDDAIAEGMQAPGIPAAMANRAAYATLWDTINGKRHPWASNPWVWVLTFKKES